MRIIRKYNGRLMDARVNKRPIVDMIAIAANPLEGYKTKNIYIFGDTHRTFTIVLELEKIK